MEAEIRRRINILNEHKVKSISQMNLRGGMQDRLHRQERLRHGSNVEKQRKNLNKRLSVIEQARQAEGFGSEGAGFTNHNIEPLDDFNEPVFRRIRSRRGFFNE